MQYSGSGDVTAETQGVDLVLPPGAENTSTSGCEAADFAGFVAGGIAVLQRGTCNFADKAANAEAAGAAGVIIFDEGQPGRTEVLFGTLGGVGATIPVVGTSFDVGVALAADDVTARIFVDALSEDRNTVNVIAETLGGRADRVVVVGAHLDSVPEGPGHKRQRQRLGRHPRDRAPDQRARHRAAQQAALRVVGRGGVGPVRLGALRREPDAAPAGEHRAQPQLRHGRLAELRLLRLRRRRQRHAGRRPRRLGHHRGGVSRLLRRAGPADRADARSTDARTTAPSSRPGSPPAASSPGPKTSRPRSRPRSTAAPPASRTIPATTRPATTSTTSASRRST